MISYFSFLFAFTFLSVSLIIAEEKKAEPAQDSKEASKPVEPSKPEDKSKNEAAGKEGENAKNEDFSHSGEYFAEKPFFKFAPLIITIFKNNQPISLVHIESSIETVDSEWEKIRLKIPVLYNNLFTDLYQSLNTLWDQVTPIAPATLEKRVQFVCDALLGKDNVKKVTIGLILVVPKKD